MKIYPIFTGEQYKLIDFQSRKLLQKIWNALECGEGSLCNESARGLKKLEDFLQSVLAIIEELKDTSEISDYDIKYILKSYDRLNDNGCLKPIVPRKIKDFVERFRNYKKFKSI